MSHISPLHCEIEIVARSEFSCWHTLHSIKSERSDEGLNDQVSGVKRLATERILDKASKRASKQASEPRASEHH